MPPIDSIKQNTNHHPSDPRRKNILRPLPATTLSTKIYTTLPTAPHSLKNIGNPCQNLSMVVEKGVNPSTSGRCALRDGMEGCGKRHRQLWTHHWWQQAKLFVEPDKPGPTFLGHAWNMLEFAEFNLVVTAATIFKHQDLLCVHSISLLGITLPTVCTEAWVFAPWKVAGPILDALCTAWIRTTRWSRQRR